MEPLFTTNYVYNYEEYKKFSWRLAGRSLMILVCAYSLVLILLGIFAVNPVYIILGLVLPLVFWLIHSAKIKRIYKSNRIMDKLERVYKFYDTYLTVEDAKSNATVEYSKLYKIIFTKTNVYLMIAKNQGYMLIKKNFPDGLEEHLKQISPKKKK